MCLGFKFVERQIVDRFIRCAVCALGMPRSLVHKSKATAVVHPYGGGTQPDSPASSEDSQQKGQFMTGMGLAPKKKLVKQKRKDS